MRKLIATAAVLAATLGLVGQAFAQCPRGTSYQCQQGYNGKVICGCR
jgi:hypothetical protein